MFSINKLIVHTPCNTATAAMSVSNAELCVLALGNPPAEGGPDHTSPKKSLLLRSLFHIESAFPRMKSRKRSCGASSCKYCRFRMNIPGSLCQVSSGQPPERVCVRD